MKLHIIAMVVLTILLISGCITEQQVNEPSDEQVIEDDLDEIGQLEDLEQELDDLNLDDFENLDLE
tara:strand:+ start:509 stop:706 length:198 start_codon:yes stop_codon:yes gene_type:complete